jgi:hypothetical protein
MLILLAVSFLKPFNYLKHYRADFAVPDQIEKPARKFVLICEGIFTAHFRAVIMNRAALLGKKEAGLVVKHPLSVNIIQIASSKILFRQAK